MSVGLFASGGMSIGWMATGGMAIGTYAGGGATWGPHTVGPGGNDQQALDMFGEWSWLTGGNSPLGAIYTPMAWILGVMVALSGLIGLMMLVAYLRHDHGAPT